MINSLPPRLQALLSYLSPGDFVADIGSDHGQLAIYLAQNLALKGIYASDNKPGPYARLSQAVADAGLSSLIQCQLADGLEHLPAGCDTLIIAGMGGDLILEILHRGQKKLAPIKKMLLSPHTNAPALRDGLQKLGFRLEAEVMTVEDDHFYELLVAVPGVETLQSYQLKFGPRLLEAPTPDFYQKWRQVAQTNRRLLAENTLPTSRQQEIAAELQLINLLLRIEVPSDD